MTLRRCEIVTNLKNGDDICFDMEKLPKVLSEKKSAIKDFSFILHDKDKYTQEESEKNPARKCGELKAAHIHLLLRFHQPQNPKYIAKWFGIKENFVSKIYGSWEDACLYQIHWNAPDKYQYDISEVTSSFDFEALVEEAEENDGNKKESPVMKIVKRILNGEIREYNKTTEIDNVLLVKNSRTINEAFKIRSEYLQATQKERNMECIYICGKSQSGKTTLAKQIAKAKGLDYFVSSGSNDILDGYCQEPVLIVDDVRPSVMGLSDLLKMLDNHTATSVKSRYKNKYLNCELVILTTVLDIDTFYKNVFAGNDEPIIQLKRRCGTYIQMDKNNIYVSIWDSRAMKYVNPVAYKNTVVDKYIPKKLKTKEDTRNHVSELMPFLELEEGEVIDTESFHLEKINYPKTKI